MAGKFDNEDIEEAQRIARHRTPEAVETLVEIMVNRANPAATRLAAANAIIAISGINRQAATVTAVSASTSGTNGA